MTLSKELAIVLNNIYLVIPSSPRKSCTISSHQIVSSFFRMSVMSYAPPLKTSRNHPISVNSLRPRQDGRHYPDGIFKCIFENENEWISPWISLKFVTNGPINNIPALVQIMAWRRRGDKPLSEPMMVSLLTHICVARPQWVKAYWFVLSSHLEFFSIWSSLSASMDSSVCQLSILTQLDDCASCRPSSR